MTVNEAKYLSKKIMEAGEVPLLIGHFGVGKTDLMREIAEETNRRLVILILSQMEPGDLIGLPARGEDRTVFLKPDWWPDDENTILLLDEINRAHRSIRNAIMQLLIDRRIHNHILPDGVWISAAMNPPDDEYDQAELITDPAFISRFFVLEITPDPNEWIEWAKRKKINSDVVNFIRDYPEFLMADRNVSIKAELKPSPRSWYKLGRVLSKLSEDDIEKYGYTLAAGIVGPEAAKAFYDSFLSNKVIPSAERLLLYGDMAEVQDINDASSVVLRIIDYLSNLSDVKLAKFKEDVKEIAENIKKLLDVLPKDSFYALIRFIVDSSEKPGLYGEIMDSLLSCLLEDPRIVDMVRKI